MVVKVLSGKVFLIVTGASKGIGEQIAVTFGRLLNKNSKVLLLARNLEGLKNTASKLPKSLKVICESVDLSVANEHDLSEIINNNLGSSGAKKYDRAVIVHNAASIGDLSKSTAEMTDLDEWRRYFDLNVASPAVLNGVFMKIFNDESKVDRLVINITSLAASKPLMSLGFYGPGKAAREMYFKIFALEFPEVNVLNYSPGPVATDMFDTLVTTSRSEEVRVIYGDMRKQKNIQTPEETVERLVSVLRDQKYNSGDNIDYYDQF